MKQVQTHLKNSKEKHSIAIQQDDSIVSAQNLISYNKNNQYSTISQTPNKKNSSNYSSPHRLVQNISKVKAQYLQDQLNKKGPEQSKMRGHQVNLMKLKDKNFKINRNIYNISVGQLNNHEAYLSSLQEQINFLKYQLKQAQQQESKRVQSDRQSQIQNSSIYYGRKTLCGRIYRRNELSNGEGRQMRSINSKGQSSSFYKWNPEVDQNRNRYESSQNDVYSNYTSAYKELNLQEQSNIKRPNTSYRVKQINNSKQISKDNIKIQDEDQRIKQQTNGGNQTESMQDQIKKQVFTNNPKWQIKSIQDDFRDKITKKLQIPDRFPLEAPDMTDTLEACRQRAPEIYGLFGIDIEKFRDQLVVRKFKNGVYYQLKSNKNILWYYDGSFYLGQWEHDLPAQSQKNGFGFQYIPNKYVYLGNYKDGMKNGQGTIKVFPKNNPKSKKFIAFDGQWLYGKPHGMGAQIDQKNTKYIGNFISGQKTGKCMFLKEQGLYYQGEVEKGLKHGKGMQKLVNGDQYSGQFSEGKFHGAGTYKWKNGSIYEGQFSKGKRQGKGKWKSQNGDQFQGQYKQDLKHGYGKFSWINGQIYEGQFRNDVRHGEGIYRHPNGKLGKFMWKKGQIDYRLYSKEQEQYRTRRQNERKQYTEFQDQFKQIQ